MAKGTTPVIVLFRSDLRIADNRALTAAAKTGKPVIAVFVLDEEHRSARPAGAASRWWLHHSLAALSEALAKRDVKLHLRSGRTVEIVAEVVETTGAEAVFWNRRGAPPDIAADKELEAHLRKQGLQTEAFDGFLLHDPTRIATQSGDFYKVFTPFYKRLMASEDFRDPADAPKSIDGWKGRLHSEQLAALKLLPTAPDWSGGLAERWQPGEAVALERLDTFLDERLDAYPEARDIPGEEGTSGLSPHLTHGELTPFQIFAALKRRRSKGAEVMRKEVIWREFSHHLLFHRPQLHRESFRPEFEKIEWLRSPSALRAWQRGLTGYPIVDAGMRELWQTGVMHNRVRMIAASFLIKHLLIDWREGERWFWDTLVDADAGNNPMNWQWVAGSGADAAPYFRIFNPILQGEKFDASGEYVRRYVPELARLPDRFIHRPFDAPAPVLADAGVELGKQYPEPIVEHAQARQRAIEAYRVVRSG